MQFSGEPKTTMTYLTISQCRRKMEISLERKRIVVRWLLYTLQISKVTPVRFIQLSPTYILYLRFVKKCKITLRTIEMFMESFIMYCHIRSEIKRKPLLILTCKISNWFIHPLNLKYVDIIFRKSISRRKEEIRKTPVMSKLFGTRKIVPEENSKRHINNFDSFFFKSHFFFKMDPFFFFSCMIEQ